MSAYAHATKLKPETIQAFNKYVKAAEKIMQKSLQGEQPFLWIDREDSQMRVQLREGEIVLHHFEEKTDIPGGMIHDWLGAVFIPGATAEVVVRVLQDFDRHKEIYPEVVDSKLIERNGDTVRGYLRFVRKKVLTVVLNTEHEASYYPFERRALAWAFLFHPDRRAKGCRQDEGAGTAGGGRQGLFVASVCLLEGGGG